MQVDRDVGGAHVGSEGVLDVEAKARAPCGTFYRTARTAPAEHDPTRRASELDLGVGDCNVRTVTIHW